MENVFLAESGSASVIDAKKTAKKKYKCPYCEARIERSKLHIHIQDEHEDLIPEGYTALRVAFNAINHKTEGHCIICKGVTDWNEDKARYERLCNNPACHEAYKKIVAERTKRIYGTERLQTDPEYADYVQRKALEGRKMSGKYTFADGGIVKYMGTYEKKFLEFMDTVMHAKSEDILAPGPSIKYKFEGQDHIYISDFFYVPYNLIVEIKDGGRNHNMHPKRQGEEEEKIKAKEKAVADLKMFNYVRVTDNDFGQLMTVMALLKYQLIHPTYNDYIIRVNEAASLNENVILNREDIYYNKDKFDSGEINLCFITGHSGSGKSTMGREMQKKGIEHYELDDLQLIADHFSMENLKEYGDLIYSYFNGPGKKFYVGKEWLKKNMPPESEYEDKLYPGFVNYAMQYAKSHKDKKFVLEGVWLFNNKWFKPSDFKDYAFYIKGTSMIVSKIRGAKRDSSDSKGAARVVSFARMMTKNWKWYIRDEKWINTFVDYFSRRVSMNEAELLEDMSGTIGAALPPAGARAPIVPTPSPMPYESDKDNYYVVQYPKNNVFAYGITKDPLQYSMVSVDPLEKGFYKVYKTDKGKINQKTLGFKVKGVVSEAMLSGEASYGDLKAKIKTIKNPHDDKSKAVKIDFYNEDEKHIGEVSISSADTNSAFVYDLEVFTEYRGKGYGRKIMEFALKNYSITDLTVDLDNTVAINLYKSLGFKIKQKWKDPTSGKTVYWMVKKATPVKESYLTFRIKNREAGKRLYNELCKIAETTGKIFDSDIQSNYIYETITEGGVILAPDQLLYDDRFELVDNPKDKLEKDMGKIYSWLKGGTLDKLQEQVDALASSQKGTDAYFVLPDGDLTLDQLKQWEHNYLMLSADDRVISNDISNEKYGADNLTRYKEKYSKLLQNSNPEKVDVSVDEASFMIPRVADILDFDDKLDQVRRVECDSSILIMVLTDRGYGFDDYSDKDIDDLKEKWNRYNALPQEYRVLSSQTASNIFGLDNDGLFNKAINTYLARQQENEAAEAEYPVDECVVPYFIPSNGVLKSNPNGIFDESGCINAYKYVKTLQELQHTLKCSKTEADREAIKEQIIDYGWNPEIPCTESALRKTYMRFEPKDIQEIDAKSFLEAQDATSEIPDGLTSEYLKDKIVPIFVVLVHGNHLHSKGIRWFTDSEWSHASLSLDSSLDEMYTFTTDIKNAPNKWHKTGFAIDTKERYLSEDPHMKVKVYALFITPEQKEKIASAIKWYIDHQDETSYGFKNILNIFMRRPTKRKMKSGDKCKMVCSQFVYTMLSLVNFKMRKSKDSSTISPADIDELSDDTRFYVVYQGGIDKYDQLKVDDLCYRLLPTLPMEMYGINESTGEAYGQPKSAIGKSDEIAKVFEMASEMLNDF